MEIGRGNFAATKGQVRIVLLSKDNEKNGKSTTKGQAKTTTPHRKTQMKCGAKGKLPLLYIA